VGRQQPQAFAIGFVVAAAIYAAVILTNADRESSPYAGILPSTRLLRPICERFVKETWYDSTTGKEIPNYSRSNASGRMLVNVRLVQQPDMATLMKLGHILFGMLFAYVTGKFAVYVYRRQRITA